VGELSNSKAIRQLRDELKKVTGLIKGISDVMRDHEQRIKNLEAEI